MKSLWNINLETLEEYYKLIDYLEKDLERTLTDNEREHAFLQLMKSKDINPSGNTELNKEELIREIASKGKTILNIDSKGYKIIKQKEDDAE